MVAMFGLGPGEITVILFLVLLLFGSHKVGELAYNLGKAVNEFKKGMREIDATAPPAPPSPAEIAMRPPPRSLPAESAHDPHGAGH